MDQALEDAIQCAAEPRVRRVLLKICKENPVCREAVTKELLLVTPAGEEDKGEKRARYAYEICSQCEEEFNVEENDLADDLCRYHPGSRKCATSCSMTWKRGEMAIRKTTRTIRTLRRRATGIVAVGMGSQMAVE